MENNNHRGNLEAEMKITRSLARVGQAFESGGRVRHPRGVRNAVVRGEKRRKGTIQTGVPDRVRGRWDGLSSLVFLVPHAWSARAAERALRGVNQGAQGRIDGLLVGEILGDVR